MSPCLDDGRRRVTNRVLGRVHAQLGFLLSMNLSCLSLGHDSIDLSNNRDRHVHLTARVNSRLIGILCVLSRPDVNLRRHSGRHLVRSLGRLHSVNGSIVIIRRSGSVVLTTSCIVSVKPGTNELKKSIIFTNAPHRVLQARALASRCLGNRYTVRIPTGHHRNGKRDL